MILMNPVVTTSTTTTMNVPQVNVDLEKLQKKGIYIGEGGSSSKIIKKTCYPKDKGKSINVEPSFEEKKIL